MRDAWTRWLTCQIPRRFYDPGERAWPAGPIDERWPFLTHKRDGLGHAARGRSIEGLAERGVQQSERVMRCRVDQRNLQVCRPAPRPVLLLACGHEVAVMLQRRCPSIAILCSIDVYWTCSDTVTESGTLGHG
jgi:hypothetical protein